jgi:hypothetical protein
MLAGYSHYNAKMDDNRNEHAKPFQSDSIESSRFDTPATSALNWQIDDFADRIEVRPRPATGSIVLTLLTSAVFACLGIVGKQFLEQSGLTTDNFCLLWIGGLGVLTVLTVGMLTISYRLGPRISIDLDRARLTLPKQNLNWPLAQIIGWQIVSEVVNSGGDAYVRHDLILLVVENDAISRHSVCAGVNRSMARRFQIMIDRLAAPSGLRLVSHVEDGVELLA